MIDPRINAIQQMNQMSKIADSKAPADNGEKPEISFREMVQKYLQDANDLQIKADDDIRKIIAGEDIDPHKVMIAVQKASLSFELVMEVRNKILEAYKEITKTAM